MGGFDVLIYMYSVSEILLFLIHRHAYMKNKQDLDDVFCIVRTRDPFTTLPNHSLII